MLETISKPPDAGYVELRYRRPFRRRDCSVVCFKHGSRVLADVGEIYRALGPMKEEDARREAEYLASCKHPRDFEDEDGKTLYQLEREYNEARREHEELVARLERREALGESEYSPMELRRKRMLRMRG